MEEPSREINQNSDFDMYILALTWAPNFCCSKDKQCLAEGMNRLNDLHPHGLWPARLTSTSYPSYCSSLKKAMEGEEGKKEGQFEQDKVNMGKKDKKKMTPRQRHEYEKHGSCTSLSFEEYFQQEEALYLRNASLRTLRDLLKQSSGEVVDVRKLHVFAGGKKIAVKASKQCQLQEITTCWSKEIDNRVGPQIDCPSYILKGVRNTAEQYHCEKVYLDASNKTCSIISKDLLLSMKKTKE